MKKLLLAFTMLALLAVPAPAAERCGNCRMKVHEDSKYMVTLTMKDGTQKLVCGLYCASMEAERAGGGVASVTTVDYGTGEKIDAKAAAWVEGSDARAMMSDVSRIAFKGREAAEKFAAEHGGRVVGYDEALANSAAEWKRQ